MSRLSHVTPAACYTLFETAFPSCWPMRRRCSPARRGRLLALAMTALAVLAQETPAQAADEAALFLLLPVGARAVGMGNAMSTASRTTEAVWWNPAGLAATRRAEASLHHSQTLVGTGDALVVTLASARLGVFAVAANLLDYGCCDVTGPDSIPSGQLYSRNIAFAGSYASQIGTRIRAGITYKLLQFRFDCSGECPDFPSRRASTSAVDAGVQYELPIGIPVSVGAVVRNIGVRLDSDDSEDLPTRIQIGALGHYAIPKTLANDAGISLAFDIIDELPVRRPLPRVGAEFSWESSVFIRGGYVVESDGTEAGGASLGIGFVVRRLTIDFARSFSGLSADAGQAPTYLSLRITF